MLYIRFFIFTFVFPFPALLNKFFFTSARDGVILSRRESSPVARPRRQGEHLMAYNRTEIKNLLGIKNLMRGHLATGLRIVGPLLAMRDRILLII